MALRGVHRDELLAELGGASYIWLLPAAGTILVGQVARAARWQVLFGAGPRPNLAAAWAILSVGYLLSNILPLRVGDPVRAWLVHTRTPADGAQALATIVVERVVDLLTILLLLGVWVPDAGVDFARQVLHVGEWLTAPALRTAILLSVVAAYLVLAVLSATAARSQRAARKALEAVGVGASRARWLSAGLGRFLRGFGPLRQPTYAAPAMVWSVAVWLIGAAGYWLVFRAFGLELPVGAAVFAVCAAALFAAVLPPSPGYVGSFHTAIRESLVVYAAVAPAKAASYAIVLHGLTLFVLVLTGVLALWVLGLSTEALGRAVGEADRSGPPDSRSATMPDG